MATGPADVEPTIQGQLDPDPVGGEVRASAGETRQEPPLAPITLGFLSEKKPNEGEDAQPLIVVGDRGTFIGVWDGLGGSGAHSLTFQELTHSAAWFASHLAREVVEETLDRDRILNDPSPERLAGFAIHLQDDLQTRFSKLAEDLGASSSRMRGSLRRALPTTFAGVIVFPSTDGVECEALWAGDSRVYALSSTSGLHQLTVDDLKYPSDPLQNLTEDSPLSNVISTEGFTINRKAFSFAPDTLFIAATDGCFAFLPAPWDFEELLLDSLLNADSPDDLRELISARVDAVTADDASLALVGFAWAGLTEVRDAFRERAMFIRAEFVQPSRASFAVVSRLEGELIEARLRFDEHRQELWARYRTAYESTLDPPADT